MNHRFNSILEITVERQQKEIRTLMADVTTINADLAAQGAALTSLEASVPGVISALQADAAQIAKLQAQIAASPAIDPTVAATIDEALVANNTRITNAVAALSAVLPANPTAPVVNFTTGAATFSVTPAPAAPKQ